MNIFVRSQENDLFKYLSDADLGKLMAKCEKKSLKAGELISSNTYSAILIVLTGKLSRYSSTGRKAGSIFPGEIDLEAGLFAEEALNYHLKSNGPSEVLLCPYSVIQNITEPELQAQIQAAINDSLCLKIASLTHRGHDDSSE
ncbi:MAG: hypothetical protein LHW56_09025 [Candidatus Cloacimonetes bacterium]|jgi:hypothetical protein|nr:hypothetical protein [Candidatus Cloacimonadota bacterium]MDY0173035.1 hypothetical protein [Candidatus Cloacimonadaceae bacterium]